MGKSEKKHRKAKGMSIRWKLIVYLAIFTAFALLVIWIFQVLLLNRFYETIKIDELNSAAATISEAVSEVDSLDENIASVYKSSLIFTKIYNIFSPTEFQKEIYISKTFIYISKIIPFI